MHPTLFEPRSRRQKLLTWSVSLLLIVIGATLLGIRARWQDSRAGAGDTDASYWSLIYDIRCTPIDPTASCGVRLPESHGPLSITREQFVHSSVAPEVIRQASSGERVLVARPAEDSGPVRLKLQFDLRVEPDAAAGRGRPEGPSSDASAGPLAELHRLATNAEWRVPDDPELLRTVAAALVPGPTGSGDLVEFDGVEKEKVTFSIERILPSSRERAGESPVIALLDLSRLPPGLADTIALVLLLPLGGLVIAASKRYLGIRSFGYFTAALLAISFVGVPWQTGAVVFGVIAAIGVSGRIAIGSLRLPKIPRLSLLLLLIVFAITFTVSVLEYLDMNPSSRGVLLPMICLTILFERFHVDTDTKGLRAASKRLVGTVFVAGLCLSLFRLQSLRALVVTQPEVEFFVAAGLILVGRVNSDGVDGSREPPATPTAVETDRTPESPEESR